MNWIRLTDEGQLNELRELSMQQPVVVFKHSTRCSISHMALNRLQREAPVDGTSFFFLDLLQNRQLSNKIAEDYQVYHESPQLLLIRNGACVYDESHNGISMADLKEQVHLLAAS